MNQQEVVMFTRLERTIRKKEERETKSNTTDKQQPTNGQKKTSNSKMMTLTMR